jgi:hypothetical protein
VFLTLKGNNMKCEYCNTEILPKDGKEFPNKKWLAGGDTVFLETNSWFHNDCQKERWQNIVTGLTYLDQPLNDCKFFVRDGSSMYGWYERDGKRYPQKLWACLDIYHLDCSSPGWITAYHENETNEKNPSRFNSCKEFVDWLKENKWWPNWWEGRKPEIYSEIVLNRRKGISTS